jgi:hypothetical protein
MGVPFAQPDDLLAAPEVNLDLSKERDLAIATRALSKATNAIVAELGWDPRESERTYSVPRESRFYRDRLLAARSRRVPIVLPAQNVTALSVDVNGTPLDASLIDWRANGIVYLDWVGRVLPITVTYTAGWAADALPDILRDVCVDLAAEGLYNPRNLREWQVGEVREYFLPAGVVARESRLDKLRLIPAIA